MPSARAPTTLATNKRPAATSDHTGKSTRRTNWLTRLAAPTALTGGEGDVGAGAADATRALGPFATIGSPRSGAPTSVMTTGADEGEKATGIRGDTAAAGLDVAPDWEAPSATESAPRASG